MPVAIGRWLIALATVAVLLPAGASFAATVFSPVNDPVGLIRSIYDGILRPDSDQRTRWLEARDRPANLSKALAALWRKADARAKVRGDAVWPIEADVTTNSQGMEVASYTLAVESRNDTRATIVVTLVPRGEWVRASADENVVRCEVVREGSRWKIDDIRSRLGDRDWSLKDLLARSLKGP